MNVEGNEPRELTSRHLALLYHQIPAEAVGLALGSIVFAFLSHRVVGPKPLLIWAAVVAVLVLLRLWVSRRYRASDTAVSHGGIWVAAFVATVVIVGGAFGVIAYKIAGATDPVHAGVAMFWLAFMAVCAIPLYAGLLWPVLGFAVPALVPAAVRLLGNDAPHATTIGVLALLAIGIAALAAYGLQRVIRRLLSLEDDTQEMQANLDSRRQHLEKLTELVRVNNEKRQKAEAELRGAAADLSLMKGKAHALSETLSRISPLCPVTGIANRRTFEEHLEAEWRRQRRLKKPVSLLMCEVDQFDSYSENYGAQSADALLHRIAKLAASVGRRAGDLAARYDGPRFALLLPGCDGRNAVKIAETLRKRVEHQKIPHDGARIGDIITGHVGVVTLIPTPEHQPRELLGRIDTAMYEAKFQGGNRIVAYRTMDKLKLEHWDNRVDDALTKHTLLQKIIVRGFDSRMVTYAPSTVLPDRSTEKETVWALLQGELRLIIEGESMAVKPGDCLYIPAGTTYGAEVVSSKDVIGYEGVRTD
ncbi:MAG: diguanylate cyclase domain-containing protein [Chromatiales bacterium]